LGRPPPLGRLRQSSARNLLALLLLGHKAVLAILDDLTIPFDNNQAERDLRTLKLQSKVSGCFRSDTGAHAFTRLRSYLSTLRKQRQALPGRPADDLCWPGSLSRLRQTCYCDGTMQLKYAMGWA
jgi:hypothetical protein